MSAEYIRSDELLNREESQLLIVDMQEKLMPAFEEKVREKLIRNCQWLIKMAELFGVPLSVTEQYPKGLGGTIPELGLEGVEKREKTLFSCVECLNWPAAFDGGQARPKIVVAGVEAHVCVQQTVLDLLALGYRVYLPADGVACRFEEDYTLALQRLANSGAILTSTESILFEWCGSAGSEEFKTLSRMLRERTF